MKTRAQLEAELTDVQGRLDPLSKQLDSLLSQFSSSIEPDVEAWISAEARRQIEANHAKVNAGGIEFVREIKTDLSALRNNLQTICGNALGSSTRWPHNTALNEQDFYTFSNNDFFSDVFRRAIASLGTILYNHGLIDDRSTDKSWKRGNVTGFEYAYNPGFDSRKHPSIDTYKELLRAHLELRKSISQLAEEIEKAKTRELWDEA
jgi:hypothetical protein